MKQLPLFIWMFFLPLFNGNSSYAQCPTPDAWMKKIIAVENGDQSDLKKIDLLESFLAILISCNNSPDSVQARVVHRLGDLYRWNGHLEKGLDLTRKAIRLNRSSSAGAQEAFLANSYYNLGICYTLAGIREAAQQAFDSAVWFGSRHPEKYFIALMAYEQMAFASFYGGDYQQSISVALKGIHFAKKTDNNLFVAILQIQQAQAELKMGNISSSEQHLQHGIFGLKEHDGAPEYLATAYSVYAALLKKREQYAKAVVYYKMSLAINKELQNWSQCSRDLMDLGLLYDAELADVTRAMDAYSLGLYYSRLGNDRYQQAGLYTNMGFAMWRKQNHQKALEYYQQALIVLPVGFNNKAWTSNPSLQQLKTVSNDYYVSTLLGNKAEALLSLFKQRNDSLWANAALATFQLADKLIDKMRWNQQSDQSKLYWREHTKSMYEKAIEACYLMQDVEKGFYFLEKSRAVLLYDKLAVLNAKQHLSANDRRREEESGMRVLQLQQRLSVAAPDSEEYNRTYEAFLAAQSEREDFIKGLEKTNPSYFQLKYAAAVLPIERARTAIAASGQSFVEYFTGDSVVYAMSLTAEGSTFLRIATPDLQSDADLLLQLCSGFTSINSRYPEFTKVAHRLYNVLFKPLNIPGGRVIISHDGSFIPFEALVPDEKVPGRFLLHDYTISYTYSAALLLRPVKQAENNAGLVGFAPVYFHPRLKQQSLHGADRSLKIIARHVPGMQSMINEKASRQHFMQLFPHYSVVQLYSHAYSDSSQSEPVIYLYDSVIGLSEIHDQSDLRTQLIVLSACQTGSGKIAKGEGIFSLARGFYAAGIPALITTLWQVDNQATYSITELFYKYLQQGKTKDEALRLAKLEYIEGGDKTKMLPYFWAPSVLIGNSEALQIKQHRGNAAYYLVAAATIIILTGVVLLVKKRISFSA